MLPPHVFIIANASKAVSSFLSNSSYSSICVLLDEHTEADCYPVIAKSLPEHKIIRVLSGEENKNINTCCLIWQQLTELTMDRHGLLIILGGRRSA